MTHADHIPPFFLLFNRDTGKLTINEVPITERDVFVYDLGNMFVIDGVVGITKDDVNASMARTPSEEGTTHEVVEAVLSALGEKPDEFSRLRDYFTNTDLSKELDASAGKSLPL
jgi:hypothetical protein